VDRLDCWVFGEQPPISAAMALIALRLILIGVVPRTVGMLYAVFLLCMLPYLAALYFGARGVYLMGRWPGSPALARCSWSDRSVLAVWRHLIKRSLG
jgi:hypothetical protein